MAKKQKHNSSRLAFLLTGLLTSALILAGVTMKQQTSIGSKAAPRTGRTVTKVYTLQKNWSVISVPGISNMTASKLCKSVPIAGVSRLIDHKTGAAENFDCNNPTVSDFVLEPHVGYFVFTWETYQLKISYTPTSQTVNYTPDYDIIGLHFMPESSTAEDVCATFIEAGLQIQAVTDYSYPPAMARYECLDPDSSGSRNFAIDQQKGYIIYSENATKPALNTQLNSLKR